MLRSPVIEEHASELALAFLAEGGGDIADLFELVEVKVMLGALMLKNHCLEHACAMANRTRGTWYSLAARNNITLLRYKRPPKPPRPPKPKPVLALEPLRISPLARLKPKRGRKPAAGALLVPLPDPNDKRTSRERLIDEALKK